MKMPKVLSWWIQKVSGERAKLDQKIKEFLSNKIILAWILKYTVQEFFEFEITEIRDMIEGEIEISSVPLEPGSPRLLLQKGKEIIINLEAQNEFRKYIVKRGFVYCARMISSQIRKEFSPPHYEQVKKMLSTALSGNLSAEDKISMLESEYNMEMASEKEVNDMCNYSEYIENLGIRKGRAEGRAEGLIEGREEGREEMRAELQPEIDALKALLIANNIPLSD